MYVEAWYPPADLLTKINPEKNRIDVITVLVTIAIKNSIMK